MLTRPASLWNRCIAALSAARAAWLLLLACIAAALVLSRLGLIFVGLWAAGNGMLLLLTAAWGVFHPRSVLRGWRSAATWALWGALVSSFTFWSYLETFVAENVGFKLGSGFTLFGLLALFALLAPLLLAGGLLGAATGALVGEDGPASNEAPPVGVTVCWVALLLTALSGGLLIAGGADEQAAPLLLGTPVFAALACRAILNGRRSPAALVHAGLGWLTRRLVPGARGGRGG